MPPVAIKYIVSFTSQDDKHPVTNLIKGDGFNKWLCSPQEKSGMVEAVFQLEQPCIISYIDVGSIWCASLEIKVGSSDWPAGRDFETLAYTVNLMTPNDCLTNKNPNKMQMFSPDMFRPEVSKKAWDRIKVICRQPYKKLTQFGLSFLRVKTATSMPTKVTSEQNEAMRKSSSVTDIQKHFLGKIDNGKNKPNDLLKSRLLKIAASSDGGTTEHNDSLSRTAKLVLAASGNKPKTYNAQSSVPNQEKNGMYSSSVEQKYSYQFDEEVDIFLKQLKIDPTELDNITMADVRHKFERKKKRKLTKEEKKIFIEKATNHLTSAFKDKTNLPPDKENVKEDKKTSGSDNTGKKNSNNEKRTCIKDFDKLSEGNNNSDKKDLEKLPKDFKAASDSVKKPSVKRKLENDITTPPPKKVTLEKNSPVTLMQKLKTAENHSPSSFEKKDLISQLKKSKPDGPINSCVTSLAGTPFQYRGLRGRESDFDSQMPDTSTPKQLVSEPSACQPHDKLKATKTMDDAFSDMVYGNFMPNGSVFNISSSDDELQELSFEMTESVGKRGRGRGSQRGRGRGRGRGKGSKTPKGGSCGDDLDSSCGVLGTPKVRGRGRGRGRGGKRGKNAISTPQQEDVASDCQQEMSSCQREMSAPRGFTRCSGCGDFFGEAFVGAHQLRCAAFKSKDTSAAKSMSTSGIGQPDVRSPASTPAKKRSNVSSLEIRPTGFAKCDGCNEYYGEILLGTHQQKCLRWKNLQQSPAASSGSLDSPWLSARPSSSPIGQYDSNSSNQNHCSSNSGNRLGSRNISANENACNIQRGSEQSDNGPMRSPPWLLAAERRLQQSQTGNGSDTQSSIVTPSSAARGSSDAKNSSSLNFSSSDSSSLPSPALDSQHWMLEKYERQKNDNSQSSQSQTILSGNLSGNKTSSSQKINVPKTGQNKSKDIKQSASSQHYSSGRQNSCISQNRFSIMELSDDSDEDLEVSFLSASKNSSSSKPAAANKSTGARAQSDLSERLVGGQGTSAFGTGLGYSTGFSGSASNVGVETNVQCPLCEDYYPSYLIEMHASNCYL